MRRLCSMISCARCHRGHGGRLLVRPPASRRPSDRRRAESTAAAAERKILYYRDPSGAPYWSAEPKKDAQGRDYLPVYRGRGVVVRPGGEEADRGGKRRRARFCYYRNPMGLPDTSPVPKKDWMGMDYIAVYEGEEQDDGKTVKVSLDKVQRSGVRTETVRSARDRRPVRAVGTVMHDEAPVDDRHHAVGRATSRICSSTRPASTFMPASRCSASTAPIFNGRRSICSSPWARPSVAAV